MHRIRTYPGLQLPPIKYRRDSCCLALDLVQASGAVAELGHRRRPSVKPRLVRLNYLLHTSRIACTKGALKCAVNYGRIFEKF
jgi:hypothetical protein